MGLSHVKIFWLILILTAWSIIPVSADSGSGVEAELLDFVMPHYRSNKLQFVLYGEKGINLGAMITFTHPLIDIVSEDLQYVELVKTMQGVKVPDPKRKADPSRLYPIDASKKEISDFWEKIPHSQAVIASEKAVYDKNKRLLSGDGQVHFRSRDLDIDGEGFEADQKRKFIHIRSNVKVVIHPFGTALKDKAKQKLSEQTERLNRKMKGDIK